MQADKAVAHLALDLRARHERGDGVHHDHVDRAGAHERFSDLERLLAGIRLGDEHILHIHAEGAGVADVERVLGVDERDLAARLLRLREDVQGERRFAGGLGAVDLHDAALGQSADAEREVERQRAGGDGLHVRGLLVAAAHDGALAVELFDLCHRRFDGALLVGVGRGGRRLSHFLCCHWFILLFLLLYLKFFVRSLCKAVRRPRGGYRAGP